MAEVRPAKPRRERPPVVFNRFSVIEGVQLGMEVVVVVNCCLRRGCATLTTAKERRLCPPQPGRRSCGNVVKMFWREATDVQLARCHGRDVCILTIC
jgi:hypothetical protein